MDEGTEICHLIDDRGDDILGLRDSRQSSITIGQLVLAIEMALELQAFEDWPRRRQRSI